MFTTKRSTGGRLRGGGFSRTATFRRANSAHPVTHFNASAFDLSCAEFEQDGEDALVKKALIMVEGDHVDSKKRPHRFPAQRIKRIFNNTVAFLASGGRVPWQQDHQKTQNANIGDLEFSEPGDIELRVIRRDDLPNPTLKHLIGKLGIFANRLVAKGEDVIQQIEAGRIKTLSPGIDTQDDIIREISATPIPAIAGLSTFRMYEDDSPYSSSRADFALTFDEAEAEMADMDALKEEFLGMGETFWLVVTSIQQATEEELQDATPEEYMQQAIADYTDRIWQLLNPAPPPEEQMQNGGMPGQQMSPQQGFSAYTLDGVEEEALGLATFRRSRRKRKSSMRQRVVGRTRKGKLTRAAGLLGTAAVLGGARYLSTRGKRKKQGVNLNTAGIYNGPEPKNARSVGSFSRALGGRDMRALTLSAVEADMSRAPAEFARRRNKRGKKAGGLRQRLMGRTAMGKAVRLGAAVGAGALAGRAAMAGAKSYKAVRGIGGSQKAAANAARQSATEAFKRDVGAATGAVKKAGAGVASRATGAGQFIRNRFRRKGGALATR